MQMGVAEWQGYLQAMLLINSLPLVSSLEVRRFKTRTHWAVTGSGIAVTLNLQAQQLSITNFN